MNLTDKEKILLRAIVAMHPVDVDSFDDEAPAEEDDFDDEEEEDEEDDEAELAPEGVDCMVMTGYVFSTKWVTTVAALSRERLVDIFQRPVWEEGERRMIMFAAPTPAGWEVGRRLLQERDAERVAQRSKDNFSGTPAPGKFYRVQSPDTIVPVSKQAKRPKCPTCARPLTSRPDLGAGRVVCYNPKCDKAVNSNRPDLRFGPIKETP